MKHQHQKGFCVICLMFTLFVIGISFPVHAQPHDGLIDTVKQIEKSLGARIGEAISKEVTAFRF